MGIHDDVAKRLNQLDLPLRDQAERVVLQNGVAAAAPFAAALASKRPVTQAVVVIGVSAAGLAEPATFQYTSGSGLVLDASLVRLAAALSTLQRF